MSQEIKKGTFAALIIESFKKNFKFNFQKPVWFYLLTTKKKKRLGPLLQRSLVEFSPSQLKKILFGRLKEVFKAWNIDVCHTTSFLSMARRPTYAS